MDDFTPTDAEYAILFATRGLARDGCNDMEGGAIDEMPALLEL